MRILSIFFILLFSSYSCLAREQLRIVGSATLYPFITIVAEKFGKISGHTPVVESTGTGGGFRLFCSGSSLNYPDIVNASRVMKPSEKALCKKNSVNNIKKITIGYDGIVIAQSSESQEMNLTNELLFLALAKKVPVNGEMVDNPYKTWKDINSNLPNHKIEIYGPSSTSGTRDAFIELAMQKFCKSSNKINKIITDKKTRLATCSAIREDGYYIEMPENYNLIIKKLIANKYALGVLSMMLLEDDPQIRAAKISNVSPDKASIINGEYPLVRPLFLYINMDHVKKIPSLAGFVNYLTDPIVLGPEGYLTKKGLISKLSD